MVVDCHGQYAVMIGSKSLLNGPMKHFFGDSHNLDSRLNMAQM
jgi:hypothetical protein